MLQPLDLPERARSTSSTLGSLGSCLSQAISHESEGLLADTIHISRVYRA